MQLVVMVPMDDFHPLNSLSFLLYFTITSLFLLCIHAVGPRTPLKSVYKSIFGKEDVDYLSFADTSQLDLNVLKTLRKWEAGIQAVRLVISIGLFGIAVQGQVWGGHSVMGLALVGFYAYSTLLSLATIFASKRWRRITSFHLSFLHFVAACIYFYYDIVPLAWATSTSLRFAWVSPRNIIRVVFLLTSGVLVPITLPREYVPVDPKNPSTPSPEQTSSWLSWGTYSFVDPILIRAFKASDAFKMDDLPPLSDSDKSRWLKKTSFPLLDPVLLGKRRHLFFSFVVYYKDLFFAQFLLQWVQLVNEFAQPIATREILSYIEVGGAGERIQPWVWIIWLAVGPALASIAIQTYLYLTTTVYVQLEAIITQLVFEHTLRIRLNSHASASSEKSTSTPPAREASSASTVVGDVSVTDVSALTITEVSTIAEDAILCGSALEASESTVVGSEDNAKTSKGDEKGSEPTGTKKVEDQSGKIMNMLTSDIKQLLWGTDWQSPFFFIIKIGICTYFLYVMLGWSALVGIAFIIVTLPVPALVASLVMKIQVVKMKKTDARLETINQVMNVLRMIKLFAWETKIEAQIAAKRQEELRYIRNSELLDVANWSLNNVLPLATMLATYTTFVLVQKQELTASVIFPSAAVFGIFRNTVFEAFWRIPSMLRAKVSLERIADYINGGELFSSKQERHDYIPVPPTPLPTKAPLIREAVFTWNKPGDGSSTPGRKRNFKLQIDEEVAFKESGINLICGPTGCGKTSLLMALLGEMYFNPDGPNSACHLPREGGVAYAAQESWVINDTIKQNILFQSPYDEERYEKVIHQTGLERDLSLLDAGDLTEVGEKGITLSGGQKARITLARAVYSNAQIVLLDDVLSALDVHTARWVADKCLGGDLLRGRTVLLVTHNILLAEPISEFVIALTIDGKIASQGSVSDALKSSAALRDQVSAQKNATATEDTDEAKTEEIKKEDDKAGKLIVAEEVVIGHVSWKAIKLYLASLGGFWFHFLIYPAFMVFTLFPILENWFLGYWSSQYEVPSDAPIPVVKYLLIYGLLLLIDVVMSGIGQAFWILGAIRASRSIHQRLINSILSSTFRWLDTVPISRVITRCSQDCQTIDGMFPNLCIGTIYVTLSVLLSFFTTIVSAGWPSVPPAIVVMIVVLASGHLYINAQMPIKRTMSNNRSPILSHVGTVLSGAVSIRAYGAQEAFKEESLRRIDIYTRTARTYWNLNRWIGFRMDAIGGVFAGIVAAWLVYGRTVRAGHVGFTLTLISSFSSFLLGWVRLVNETEVQANSVERIQEYLEIDHEPAPNEDGKPPAYWPSSGELRVEHLSARYSLDGPLVLNDMSFTIKSGERVGVVGRTGAGKSTISMALLRAIPTEGTVYYDGLDTGKLNLDALRSNMTLIPQHPELLNGTLRENLDPFSEHDDALLNNALRSAGLYQLQTEEEEGAINLESEVQAGGSNFSQGQRQILALARAIVRQSRLLILDEATAAIDYKTDQAIQHSIRSELNDVTVITVAHRLKTIMDSDKIMVLDAGKMIEFDSPQTLLDKKSGFFHRLVEESSDKEELYRLARR